MFLVLIIYIYAKKKFVYGFAYEKYANQKNLLINYKQSNLILCKATCFSASLKLIIRKIKAHKKKKKINKTRQLELYFNCFFFVYYYCYVINNNVILMRNIVFVILKINHRYYLSMFVIK